MFMQGVDELCKSLLRLVLTAAESKNISTRAIRNATMERPAESLMSIFQTMDVPLTIQLGEFPSDALSGDKRLLAVVLLVSVAGFLSFSLRNNHRYYEAGMEWLLALPLLMSDMHDRDIHMHVHR